MVVRRYKLYYRLFSFRFVIRAFFVKVLRLYTAEVKQLDIADELATRCVTLQRLDGQKVKPGIIVNGVHLNIILRKNTSDLLVFHQVLLRSAYQPLIDLVNRYFAGQVKTIVDVGGNIGLTSLFFGCYFDSASIFVIEPSPNTFSLLEMNLRANNVNAKACHMALMNKNGKVKINKTFRDKQDWSTQVLPTDLASAIDAVSFSEFRRQHEIPTIDILKIDIEGHEAELFDSIDFISELKTVRFLALEIHEEKADRISIITQLQAQGFILTYKGETLFGANLLAL